MAPSLSMPGTTLRYTVSDGAGEGETPALLLHPWFGCDAFWGATANRLECPSYAVDWYSLGNGSWSAYASPDGLARAALLLLDAIGVERVDIVGNSVGGIVAQILACRRPDRVRRLVLVGTGASLSGPPHRFGELVAAWIDRPADRHAMVAELVDALTVAPVVEAARRRYVQAVCDADAEFISSVLIAARSRDLRPELPLISAPTLVIRGQHDTARGPEHVADLLGGIPDCRAVEMPGCGHSPMIEQPEAFAELVNEHLFR